jgi:DNA helicase-2/ATP-dependent DNA helicase PcrA
MTDSFDLAYTDDSEDSRHAPSGAATSGGTMPYLDALNPEQRRAVEATEGPVLVLAGAGTGKTRVLTTRLAYILANGLARPGEVLAVTFTNKASREMKSRIEGLLRRPVESLWLGTFHAMGARMLRQHAELVGLKPNFTILDTDDQLRLMRQVIEAAGLDEKKWPARTLAAIIDRWKDRGIGPEQSATERGDFAFGKAPSLYAAYQDRLRTLNAADFGDLLLHCLTIFGNHPDVLADYQRRFRYVLVDEYQDANVAQYLWLRLLARVHHNICCVGDDDQSIYGWRGAEVGNILRFEKDFKDATIIRLEQNYRSTSHILRAASGLIARNEGRLGKTLWTEESDGERIRVRGVWDGEEEARYIGDEIELLQSQGHRLDGIAILVRAVFQMREFEERFLTLGLPYRVIGGLRFYERREIRDAVAYLRVIAQPDDDLAFERIVNVPRRGIGDASLQAIHVLAREQRMPLVVAAATLVTTDELRPQARRALSDLLASFERWRDEKQRLPHAELAEMVLDESGYTAMWQNDKSPDAPGKLENLKELVAAIEEFGNLEGFLEHVSLVMDNEDSGAGDKVNMMTLHAAKGLEFDTVFLPGWEEGVFPNQRSLDEGGTGALEEERRLAHVGLTRARKRAFVTFAGTRRIYNQWQSSIPSRFVSELPEESVDLTTDLGIVEHPRSGDPDEPPGSGRPVYGQRRSRYDRAFTSGGLVIEGRAVPASRSPTDTRFSVGDRIFHQKFGYGSVRSVEGDRLEIAFEKAGTKKVIASFVEPT